jgi:hypothetical protein
MPTPAAATGAEAETRQAQDRTNDMIGSVPYRVQTTSELPIPERCKHCGPNVMLLRWQRFRNNTKHIRAECWSCGRFVGYVKQTPDTVQTREALSETIGGRV